MDRRTCVLRNIFHLLFDCRDNIGHFVRTPSSNKIALDNFASTRCAFHIHVVSTTTHGIVLHTGDFVSFGSVGTGMGTMASLANAKSRFTSASLRCREQ
jgi:hypothetical protein